ncbi:hypothetical protein AZI86_12690 [Bdellovibrio bacteriovorus]|uniref:histidine kinase n=1 Tax=Bdellovibrio bacteriovorus TaxID=959 RepID=A0A150WJI4_BDEBC|nr:response regulator [Bdellovibrio bacteriovorus]KYG63681.1 hypothetical protein AZI86_12690 [Bdellovibrio bacteriovorus]
MMEQVNILLVDDIPENINALSNLIAADGITIYSATNANDALELISRHDFGLLLLDVQMPGTNGFELAKIIRSVDRYKGLPIVFVTAHQPDIGFIFEGYQTGAVDLLFKPLIPAVVRTKVSQFVEIAQQKNQLKRQVVELEVLKARADIANAAKSAFLANMSHEIRTPLGSIMGFAEVCQQDDISLEEMREYSKVIYRNTQQVLKLVDDILDLAKVEAGKIAVEAVEFSLKELFSDIENTFLPQATRKGLEFSIVVANPFPEYVKSDPTRIRQVLLNAIGNAIKFTSQGFVRLTIRYAEPLLIVDIQDTGTGITPEQSKSLFQAFQQAEISTARRFGGTGLGLFLNRQLCQLLGGDYSLKSSVEGAGSVFRATFRVDAVENVNSSVHQMTQDTSVSEAAVNASRSRLEGLRILVVDDSEDNRELMRVLLQNEKAHLDFAANGFEAIEKAVKGPFKVVLMDIQMPLLDGYQTLAKLREAGFAGVVIALTAHAMSSEVDKVYAAGFDGYLSKPVTKELIIKKLLEIT